MSILLVLLSSQPGEWCQQGFLSYFSDNYAAYCLRNSARLTAVMAHCPLLFGLYASVIRRWNLFPCFLKIGSSYDLLSSGGDQVLVLSLGLGGPFVLPLQSWPSGTAVQTILGWLAGEWQPWDPVLLPHPPQPELTAIYHQTCKIRQLLTHQWMQTGNKPGLYLLRLV